jgi:hypothetical protein
MLLSIYWLDRGTREARSSDLWLAGLATGVMALIHPYSLPLLFCVGGCRYRHPSESKCFWLLVPLLRTRPSVCDLRDRSVTDQPSRGQT